MYTGLRRVSYSSPVLGAVRIVVHIMQEQDKETDTQREGEWFMRLRSADFK